MKLVKPSFEILSEIDSEKILKSIEVAGRTCYKSEDKITKESASKFVKMIIDRGHESVLEHEKITVKFICDRGVSHEIVRHRICSFSQESTRYVNYNKKGMEFIIPCWIKDINEGEYLVKNWDTISPKIEGMPDYTEIKAYRWALHMLWSERMYNYLLNNIDNSWKPEQARSVLPNSLKTEIVVTANLRQWREIFRQRTSVKAHPQMREIMIPLLDKLKKVLPVIFDNITY